MTLYEQFISILQIVAVVYVAAVLVVTLVLTIYNTVHLIASVSDRIRLWLIDSITGDKKND